MWSAYIIVFFDGLKSSLSKPVLENETVLVPAIQFRRIIQIIRQSCLGNENTLVVHRIVNSICKILIIKKKV